MSFINEEYLEVLYFKHAGLGSMSGQSQDNAAVIATNAAIFQVPAGVVVEDVDVIVQTAITGSTDIDLGDAGDADGLVDGSVDLTLGTPAAYDGAGVYIASGGAKYYAAATNLALLVTGASTTGQFQIVIKGYRVKPA